ncbi:hypothetical protein PSCICO_46940 [Pseudomonas cichorii]|nr:hypothetical protein PSCICO_46940 [Pseudomonas cichorii]
MIVHRTPLAEFAAKRHAWTARLLGMSQGALSKAIREGREIYVVALPDGSITAIEERPFPSQKRDEKLSEYTNNSPSGSIKSGAKVPVCLSSTTQASP